MTDIERLIGNKAIAAALGVTDEDTVTAWGALAVDPLPLRDWMGSVCGWPPYLADWKARRADLAAWRARRPQGEPGLAILVGWEAITEAFPTGRSLDTAQRAAEPRPEDPSYHPLPVVGLHLPAERLTRPGGPPRVWIYKSALRDWIDWRDRPHVTGATRPRPAMASAQMSLF